MKRINVTFYDETLQQLEARAIKTNNKSIPVQVRELVELGLKFEAALEKEEGTNQGRDTEKLLLLLKNNLIWSLETRLLARYLIDKLPKNESSDHSMILEKYKEKAIDHVEGMLNAVA